MLSTALLLFIFCCVALFNARNSIQQMMIRIDADEHFTAFRAGCASQGTLSQDVKEDLKKNFFTSLKNISQNQSLDEFQRDSFGATNLRIDLHMWEQCRYFANP